MINQILSFLFISNPILFVCWTSDVSIFFFTSCNLLPKITTLSTYATIWLHLSNMVPCVFTYLLLFTYYYLHYLTFFIKLAIYSWIFYVLLTVHLCIFISVINQLDAQNFCFTISFISCLYMFRAPCAHHQEVKIALHSLWYHHTYRWPSRAQVWWYQRLCNAILTSWWWAHVLETWRGMK